MKTAKNVAPSRNRHYSTLPWQLCTNTNFSFIGCSCILITLSLRQK